MRVKLDGVACGSIPAAHILATLDAESGSREVHATNLRELPGRYLPCASAAYPCRRKRNFGPLLLTASHTVRSTVYEMTRSKLSGKLPISSRAAFYAASAFLLI